MGRGKQGHSGRAQQQGPPSRTAGREVGSSLVEKWLPEGWAPGPQRKELDLEGPGPRALPEKEAGKDSGQPSAFAITDLVPQAWILWPEETQKLDSLT